jgi:thiol-disulfide isomerase/thioredoxin
MRRPLALVCRNLGWFVFTVLLFSTEANAQTTDAAFRTWRDVSGKFEVEATLLTRTETHVRLRNRDDREIEVPIEKLSREDRDFIAEYSPKEPSERVPSVTTLSPSRRAKDPNRTDLDTSSRSVEGSEAIKQVATAFFADLRNTDRNEAASLLSDTARALVDAKKSALPMLPAPDPGPRSIRVGKQTVKGDQASVVVVVSVSGTPQRTFLQLRKLDEAWKIIGLQAWRDDVEVTIDFEKPWESKPAATDPVAEWMGKPLMLSGLSLDGRRVTSDQFRGKVVLIDFWATWCGPCIKEMPNVLENYAKYHNAGFEVIAISLDDDMMELQNFVTKENPPWVVLADKHPQNTESMAQKVGVRAIPTLLLIGPDGTVIDVNCRGPRLGAKLAEVFGR